jgi:hypothetical protein
MTARHLVHLVLGVGICVAAGAAAPAGGAIGGHVRDARGQPLPGVAITVLPERGGAARQSITDSDGAYHLEGLPDATYRIDFLLLGFDLTREHQVSVRTGARVDVDATLAVSPICECVTSGLPTSALPLTGQVVDAAHRPLPHARLDVVSPARRETAYTDSEGRFRVRVPLEGAWPLTASEARFASITTKISTASAEPIVLKLSYRGTAGLPKRERISLGCLCPEYFGGRE